MTTAELNTFETNELDALQQKFAAQNLETLKDSEEEPKESSGSPERPLNITQDGKKVMLVAAKSKVKPVAGSIARTMRETPNEPPILSAVGAASVNQTVKAIAIARDFLEADNIDLAVEVTKRPTADVKDVLVFHLSKHERGSLIKVEEDDKENAELYQDMRSAASSTPGSLAGAIAKNVRLNKRPRITAIGQKPVFKAICAIALARKYLKKENMDVDMVPRFIQVNFENGSEANALQLIVIPRSIA